jgi:DNA-binding Lrp family transcriptional regulator
VTTSDDETTTLDRLDRQLLHALRINGRAPFRLIAEVLGSSEQTVARRYRRLREAGIVRVNVLPALGGPGLDWFMRIGIRPGAAERFAAALAQRSDVSWVSITSGGAEIVCVSRPSSPEQRDALLLERLPRTNAVTTLVAHAILRSFEDSNRQRWNAFGDPLEPAQVDALVAERSIADGAEVTGPLSTEDRELLAALGDDGRATYAQLGAATNSSANRVARRLESLIASRTVEIETDLALEVLGFPTVATIWMAVPPSDLDEVGWRIASLSATAYAAAVTGPTNLLATVVCRTPAELYEYVTRKIGAITAIGSIEVSPVIRRVKAAASIIEGTLLPRPV